ncbi:MAG: hypothetical protein F9K37_07445 [Bacteroidales bacterium]|nr:MAG: hypothetical protein F9K37_07445 [Bacteroidales bacterium]
MRKIVLSALLILLLQTSYSQVWKRNRLEVYAGLPINHFFGDIGGTADKSNLMGLKDISFRAMRPGISLGSVFRLNHQLYIQGGVNIGYLGSTDEGSRNENRNYGFSTLGTEITATVQFYLIPESEQNYFYSVMQLRGGLRHINKPISVYVFGGTGALFYKVDPRLDLIDSDRFNNKETFTTIIPLGAGVKYQLLPRTLINAELGARVVLSDFLDGFSPTQSKHNDIYYTLNFRIIYRLPYENLLKKFK